MAKMIGFGFACDSSGGEGIDVFPVCAPADLLELTWPGSIPRSEWSNLVGQGKTKTYRELADEYGVSRESVRRTLGRAKSGAQVRWYRGRCGIQLVRPEQRGELASGLTPDAHAWSLLFR